MQSSSAWTVSAASKRPFTRCFQIPRCKVYHPYVTEFFQIRVVQRPEAVRADFKSVYKAPTKDLALSELEALKENWGQVSLRHQQLGATLGRREPVLPVQ